MRELTELRRDYSKHLKECTQLKAEQAKLTIADASSEDEHVSSSDNGTSLTEPEVPSPLASRGEKPVEHKEPHMDDLALGEAESMLSRDTQVKPELDRPQHKNDGC